MTPLELAQRLRAERLALGIMQKDVAAALHIDRAALSMWENGRRTPPLHRITEWARQLGLELTLTD